MKLSIIACQAEDGTIGIDGKMPWRHVEDMKMFRALTAGKTVLCGRKTFESLNPTQDKPPLPGRHVVVLSTKYHEQVFNLQRSSTPNVFQHHDSVAFIAGGQLWPDKVIDKLERAGAEEVFVIGGAEIYHQFLPDADRVYLTTIYGLQASPYVAPERVTKLPFFDRQLRLQFKECTEIKLGGEPTDMPQMEAIQVLGKNGETVTMYRTELQIFSNPKRPGPSRR